MILLHDSRQPSLTLRSDSGTRARPIKGHLRLRRRESGSALSTGCAPFSDAPCGATAVAREISEPNRMDSARVLPTAIQYGAPGSYYRSGIIDADTPGASDDGVAFFDPLGVRPPRRRPPHHGSGPRMRSTAMAPR